ncbi:MAG: VanZ family protein [Phycisphaerae bacterium]
MATLIVFVALVAVRSLPRVPYNYRQLFGRDHPMLSAAVFSVALVWLVMIPPLICRFAARRPVRIWVVPWWLAICLFGEWVLVRFAVPMESLHDVLGTPIYRTWGGDWELILRFLALTGALTLSAIAGLFVMVGLSRRGPVLSFSKALVAVVWLIPWMVLCRWVIVPWASTDNLVELLRGTAVGLDMILLAIPFISALAGGLLIGCVGYGRFRWLPLTLPFAGATILLNWVLLNVALDPAVEGKSGLVFPALRFLLGPDRITDISDSELLLRWSVINAAGMVAIGVAWRITGVVAAAGSEMTLPTAPRPPVRRRIRRCFAWLLVLYAIFLLYGSTAPFRFIPTDLSNSIDRFWLNLSLTIGVWSHSDLVTNTIMFVPLSFAAMGTFSRRNDRWFQIVIVLLVLGTGLLFTVLLEYVQIFLDGRTPAIHDIIAQTIGSLIGVTLWFLAGRIVCRWLAAIHRRTSRATGLGRILAVYLVLVALYLLHPYNVTISVSQLWSKMKTGRVVLIPFQEPLGSLLFSAGVEALLFAPVGWLTGAIVGRKGGSIGRGVMITLGIIVAVELAQLLVLSRYSSTSDVILAGIPASIACFFGRRWAGRRQPAGPRRPSRQPGDDAGSESADHAGGHPAP